jgi:hypothetical protein
LSVAPLYCSARPPDVVDDPISQQVDRLRREVADRVEAECRAYLRAARTHRLNVTCIHGLPTVSWGEDQQLKMEIKVTFTRHFPRGWTAPLP